jgi:hypothetical protein
MALTISVHCSVEAGGGSHLSTSPRPSASRASSHSSLQPQESRSCAPLKATCVCAFLAFDL